MRKNVLIILMILILLSVLYSKEKKIETEVLQPVRAINFNNDPKTASRFLGYIAMDADNNIYMINNLKGYIIKMNEKGDFICRIGEKGQGPGDLLFPYSNIFIKNKLIVLDNNAFSFFDKNGNYLHRFRKYLPYDTFAADSKYIYAYLPRKKGGVITMYDYNGKKIRSFGKRFLENISRKMDFSSLIKLFKAKIIVTDKYVYLIYLTPALIYKFDKEGELILKKTIKFNNKKLNDIQKNIRKLIRTDKYKREKYLNKKYNYGQLLTGLAYNKLKFYLLFSSLIDRGKTIVKGRILKIDSKTFKEEKMYGFYDINNKKYGLCSKIEYADKIVVKRKRKTEYFFIPLSSKITDYIYIGIYKTKNK